MIDTDTSPEEQQQSRQHAERRVLLPQRAYFLQLALNAIGSLYRWGGKGEVVRSHLAGSYEQLFDCSGLVTWAYHLAGGPDWRATHNTDRLLLACREVPVAEGKPGDLAFYGTARDAYGDTAPNPSHVMVLAGAGVVVGASGGDSSTTSLESAIRAQAKVQARLSMDYRKDFLGVWRLPFAGE